MNKELLQHILIHVYNGLGITEKRTVSLKSEMFRMTEPMNIVLEDKSEYQAPMYAAQAIIQQATMRFLCADLSYQDEQEFALIIELDGCPTYASYLVLEGGQIIDAELAVLIKNKWLDANTFLQASFLAGMEQLREMGVIWQADPTSVLKTILHSFLEYVDE
jgi:hypothetical protein